MVAKGIPEPDASICFRTDERQYLSLRAQFLSRALEGKDSKLCFGTYFSGCVKEAMKFIDALPDPQEAVTRKYLSRVAAAVDFATENSIADEYVAPLRGVTCAMTDNLLTKDADQ